MPHGIKHNANGSYPENFAMEANLVFRMYLSISISQLGKSWRHKFIPCAKSQAPSKSLFTSDEHVDEASTARNRRKESATSFKKWPILELYSTCHPRARKHARKIQSKNSLAHTLTHPHRRTLIRRIKYRRRKNTHKSIARKQQPLQKKTKHGS